MGGYFFCLQTNDAQNDNFYPFVHLLPNNLLYIFANRDSILYNWERQITVKGLKLSFSWQLSDVAALGCKRLGNSRDFDLRWFRVRRLPGPPCKAPCHPDLRSHSTVGGEPAVGDGEHAHATQHGRHGPSPHPPG